MKIGLKTEPAAGPFQIAIGQILLAGFEGKGLKGRALSPVWRSTATLGTPAPRCVSIYSPSKTKKLLSPVRSLVAPDQQLTCVRDLHNEGRRYRCQTGILEQNV